VIQEWWGLVPHIENVTDRFAAAGFLALAPDLYHGTKTTSPDTAGRLAMELSVEQAGRDIAGAGAYLLARNGCDSTRFGVVGFCMGGALAQFAATTIPKVAAAASFYGGFKRLRLDYARLHAPLLLFYGGKDEGVPAAEAEPLVERLRQMGKVVEAVVYEKAGHAFFNDERAEVYDHEASEDAFRRTLAHFRKYLAVGA